MNRDAPDSQSFFTASMHSLGDWPPPISTPSYFDPPLNQDTIWQVPEQDEHFRVEPCPALIESREVWRSSC